MKTSISITMSATIAASLLAQTLYGGPITGNIGFGGSVTFNTTSAATATVITGWLYTQVVSDSGTFAEQPYAITPVAPATFTSATWNLNTTTPITNFWSAGGFNLELLGSQIIAQGGTPGVSGYSVIQGVGIVSGNGFTPTACVWVFTCQDPQSGSNPAQWTFSGSCNIIPIKLQSQVTTNAIILSWPAGLYLQSAPTLNGNFTDIPGATSPYTNHFTGSQQFFRLSSN